MKLEYRKFELYFVLNQPYFLFRLMRISRARESQKICFYHEK